MPEIILNCPQCERSLRVPENLIGRLVQCPACGLTFSVPAGSTEAQPVFPLPVTVAEPAPGRGTPAEEYESEEDYDELRARRRRPGLWDLDQEEREKANALITPPAIGLLITGILGLLGNCFRALVFFAAEHKPLGPEVPELFRRAMEMVTPQMVLISAAVFAGLSLLVVLGAVQMLRRRMYGLAITSSIVAMINLECLCCVLGLPLGIWSLVVLSRPEVRSLFQ